MQVVVFRPPPSLESALASAGVRWTSTLSERDIVGADLVVASVQDAASVRSLRSLNRTACLMVLVPGEPEEEPLIAAGADYVVDATDPTAVVRALRGAARLLARVVQAGWRGPLDSIDLAILVIDAELGVQIINERARSLLGGSLRDVLDAPLEVFAAWEPFVTVTALARRVLAGEVRLRQVTHAEDGGPVWEISADLDRVAGSPERRVIVSIREVTAEVQLQRINALNQRLVEIGSIVSGVAHEVRNPLFGISAICDALDVRFRDQQLYVPHLDKLRSVVARLNKLMSDLLDLGSSSRLELTEIEPEVVVRDAWECCQVEAAAHRVQLRIERDADVRPIVVDRFRMLQVVQNVLDNAIRFSPQDSSIELQLASSGAWTSLTIRDHGPGFGVDRARVFDPFFSRRSGGTGLGLALVRQYVERHGGTVVAEDDPRGGAIIRIAVPQRVALGVPA